MSDEPFCMIEVDGILYRPEDAPPQHKAVTEPKAQAPKGKGKPAPTEE